MMNALLHRIDWDSCAAFFATCGKRVRERARWPFESDESRAAGGKGNSMPFSCNPGLTLAAQFSSAAKLFSPFPLNFHSPS